MIKSFQRRFGDVYIGVDRHQIAARGQEVAARAHSALAEVVLPPPRRQHLRTARPVQKRALVSVILVAGKTYFMPGIQNFFEESSRIQPDAQTVFL